ncbi:MAG: nucleoside/nucleotide kinase family protein [Janthinobacterium lividum]
MDARPDSDPAATAATATTSVPAASPHVPDAVAIPPAVLARAAALIADGSRRLLGIAGSPGAGKSTFAAALAHALGERAQLVPMDGFHLANRELARLGRAARKGAPDTFDVAGYVALLARLRGARDAASTSTLMSASASTHVSAPVPIYAPAFHREIEESIAGEIAILPETSLVITEGNYLLLDQAPWHAVAPLLDECWFVRVDADLRRERLLARHQRYGRDREDALCWMAQTDEPNARLIDACAARADLIIRWDE